MHFCIFTGIVGELEESSEDVYIWTHKKFDIGVNNKQIVDVNLTSESKVKLAPNIKIPFSYEVFEIHSPFFLWFPKPVFSVMFDWS